MWMVAASGRYSCYPLPTAESGNAGGNVYKFPFFSLLRVLTLPAMGNNFRFRPYDPTEGQVRAIKRFLSMQVRAVALAALAIVLTASSAQAKVAPDSECDYAPNYVE